MRGRASPVCSWSAARGLQSASRLDSLPVRLLLVRGMIGTSMIRSSDLSSSINEVNAYTSRDDDDYDQSCCSPASDPLPVQPGVKRTADQELR